MTKKVIETTNGWYMENEKEKVELEDIIGLVQTDEPTNSVQLKKEAQLSICEKRIIELRKENEQLKQELKVYRKVASCSDCKYHNYDWDIDDGYGGEEYEVCDKGNDVTYGICEEWEEL